MATKRHASPISDTSFDTGLWTRWVEQAELENPATVSVLDYEANKEWDVHFNVISLSSESSAEQFGFVKKRRIVKDLFDSMKKISKDEILKHEILKLLSPEGFPFVVPPLGTSAFEVLPPALLPSGVWVPSSSSQGCTFFVLTGKPINPDLTGIVVQAIDEKTFDGGVFKVFSAENSKILGQGGNGVAVLVIDRTDPRPKTWKPVVLKIEVSDKIRPDNDAEAMRGGTLKEVAIAEILNKAFYSARVTPSVTRTFAIFQCESLPPTTGAWNALTSKIWPATESDNRAVVASNPDVKYLYVEQEWANAGTVDDILENNPGHDALKFNLETDKGRFDHKAFIRSVAFQGLYTLEAFRRVGFVHADLNSKNIAFTRIPDESKHIYFTNGTGNVGEKIRGFDPFTPYSRDISGNVHQFMLKFIDYGLSSFEFPGLENTSLSKHHTGRISGRRVSERLTTLMTSPPESMMRAMTYETEGYTLSPMWWLSNASDVWQFGLALVSLAVQKDPLTDGSTYRLEPPAVFTNAVNEYIHINAAEFQGFITDNIDPWIAPHLWNIAAILVGFPGIDFETGEMDEGKRLGLEHTYPILQAFRTVGYVWKGWLREEPRIEALFGQDMRIQILKMLQWERLYRPTPGEILENERKDYFGSFMARAASQFLVPGTTDHIDTGNVSIRSYNRVMKGTKENFDSTRDLQAWSLVQSDISYQVSIDSPLAAKSNGSCRFDALPKYIHESMSVHPEFKHLLEPKVRIQEQPAHRPVKPLLETKPKRIIQEQQAMAVESKVEEEKRSWAQWL